jgi:hypothetical protein
MTIITRLLSATMIALGIGMVSIALSRGGGPLAFGVILGLFFIAAGGGRLWLSWRR